MKLMKKSWILKEYLKSLGADFHRVNRGGLITFHGPGQLVAYPILQLERRNAIRWYVDSLENAIIDLLSEFNLKGEKSPHTGEKYFAGHQSLKVLNIFRRLDWG